MIKRADSPSGRIGKLSRAAKILQRAMRKSEAKEPPTVGKPVINDPPAESEADGQRAISREG